MAPDATATIPGRQRAAHALSAAFVMPQNRKPMTTTQTRRHRRITGDMHAAFITALDLADDMPDADEEGLCADGSHLTRPHVEMEPFTVYEASEHRDEDGDVVLTKTGQGYDVTVSWTVSDGQGDEL